MKSLRDTSTFRTGEFNVHDRAFLIEMRSLTRRAKEGYMATFYKDAVKYGFYEFQASRDWYREVTSVEMGGNGMHRDLIWEWIRLTALLSQPIIPHFSEYLWMDVLENETSVQKQQWPDQATILGGEGEKEMSEADESSTLAQLAYMRGVLSTMRSAESQIARRKQKGKNLSYDPSKPRSARIYVATGLPSWQVDCMGVLEWCWSEKEGVDENKLRGELAEKGMLKDKRVMPFIQGIKVSEEDIAVNKCLGKVTFIWSLFAYGLHAYTSQRKISEQGPTTAFSRSLPYSELDALTLLLPYIQSSMRFIDISVCSQSAAIEAMESGSVKAGEEGWERTSVDKSEPGSPETVFWNVV